MSVSNTFRPLTVSVAMALGTAGSLGSSGVAEAAIVEMNWQGWFTMLNIAGDTLLNSSINSKVANQYITPITGTLNYDTLQGDGTVSITPFDFQGNPQNVPFTVHDATFESIGDGNGGSGSLMLGNMLYDWNNNTNVSFSLVWDAAGMLQGLGNGDTNIIGIGGVPAVDGTYTNYDSGTFVNFGASPMATTTFDTTNVAGCVNLDCIGYNPSGTLPLITDTSLNENKSFYASGDVFGVGGSPVQDSGFQFKSLNFDMTAMQVIAITEVPVLPSVWLFGSGLFAMLSFLWGARRAS